VFGGDVLFGTPPTANRLVQRMLSSTQKTLLRAVQWRVHYKHQIYPAILSLLLNILPHNRGFLHHPQRLLCPVVDFDTELAPTQTTREEINVDALSFSSTGAAHMGHESSVQCFPLYPVIHWLKSYCTGEKVGKGFPDLMISKFYPTTGNEYTRRILAEIECGDVALRKSIGQVM